jgi:hypothetical protein
MASMTTGIDRMHPLVSVFRRAIAPAGDTLQACAAGRDPGFRHLACLLAFLAAAPGGRADDPSSGRAGGLVPGSANPRSGMTREELIREWDLDGDGTISKPEADVAKGRMRRKRLDMQLGVGIDPLTGLPRGIDPANPEADTTAEDEPLFRLPPEPPPQPKQPEASLPGMRPPAMGAPSAGQGPILPAAPTPAMAPAVPGGGSGPQSPARSGRASWLPPQRLAPSLTGGVRAGAPAAAPGYGSGPWSDLNAGRRPAIQPADGQPAPTERATGGLLPSSRPPGRTGSLIIPAIPGQAPGPGPAPRPAAPPAPLIPQPRITADEIGGYRP